MWEFFAVFATDRVRTHFNNIFRSRTQTFPVIQSRVLPNRRVQPLMFGTQLNMPSTMRYGLTENTLFNRTLSKWLETKF